VTHIVRFSYNSQCASRRICSVSAYLVCMCMCVCARARACICVYVCVCVKSHANHHHHLPLCVMEGSFEAYHLFSTRHRIAHDIAMITYIISHVCYLLPSYFAFDIFFPRHRCVLNSSSTSHDLLFLVEALNFLCIPFVMSCIA